jgi:hypothetical protein
MTMYAGLDVGGKRTADKIVWRGMVDTHPELLASALKRFEGELTKVGLESSPSFAASYPRSFAADS